ncbi:MAG: 50S ribosomal protein L29 [Bacteroidetes bacterium]|nr:50S ribosomal protein L29 [Bacteroidota bacterium]
MLKPHEVRPMSEKEIMQRIKDNLEALDKMKFQKAVGGEVKNPVQIRFLRKEIAMMKTILHEREIDAKKKNSDQDREKKASAGEAEKSEVA